MADPPRAARKHGGGSAFEAAGRYYLVVSLGEGVRAARRVATASTLEQARARARVAAALVAAMRDSGLGAKVDEAIRSIAAAAGDDELREIERRYLAEPRCR